MAKSSPVGRFSGADLGNLKIAPGTPPLVRRPIWKKKVEWPGLSLTQKKKNPVQNQVISKEPAGTPCAQPWLWQLAVGGWRQLAVGSWQLAVGGGWWWLAAVGGWRLVVGGSWQWLAVGGWSPLAVGGGWWLAVGGGWWLAVGGGWQLMGVGGWRLVVPWGCP